MPTPQTHDLIKLQPPAGQVGPVTDRQALEWYEANALMWAVVIHPWVLVQPLVKEQ